jgi:tetratricopeptide (TPR) repeat protein
VEDDTIDARSGGLAQSVEIIEAAILRFRQNRGDDPSELYGAPIERAVDCIIHVCSGRPTGADGPHVELIVEGLAAVAWLHYARFYGSPHKPGVYLWSAVRLFTILRRSPPHLVVRTPRDVKRVFDVLAADDAATVLELGDPADIVETAGLLVEFAAIEHDIGALSRAEALLRRVLDALAPTNPDRVICLSNLANVLARRSQWAGADLAEEIIALVDAIVDPVHQTDPRWLYLQANAGGACHVAAACAQSSPLLDRAIDLTSRAVRSMPEDQPEKAGFLENLGRAEVLRWAWRHGLERPEDALTSLKHAIRCTVPGDPDVASHHVWLAIALLMGDPPDSVEAAQQLAEAETLNGVDGVRADSQLLGEAWLLLWRTKPRNEATLDRAIALLNGVEPNPAGLSSRGSSDILAGALWERWERTRDIADVDEVIARLAPRAEAGDAPPLMLNHLARSLRARWERTGDSVAIRHAINCLTAAVERSAADNSARRMYLNNLGGMWLRLHEATGERTAVEQAVRYTERALAECPSGDANRPMYTNTTAVAYFMLWKNTGVDTDLQRSVDLSRLAVSITPSSHAELPTYLANLGGFLMYACVQFDDPLLHEEAVKALRSAKQYADPDHPMYGAVALNFGQALLKWGHAHGDVASASRGRDLIQESAYHTHVRAEDAIRAARLWADEAASAGDWRAAADALSSAVDRLVRLPGHRIDRSDHERLLVRLAGLAEDAAAAWSNDEDYRRAVECLESGRGVLLAKTLRHDDILAALHRRDTALATRLRQVQTLLVTE